MALPWNIFDAYVQRCYGCSKNHLPKRSVVNPEWSYMSATCSDIRIDPEIMTMLLKLEFHSASTKNTSLGDHFRFIIFSLFQFVSYRNVYKPKGVENLVNGFRPA